MNTDKFTMYDAVQSVQDVRHLVAIMFGTTDRAFIKRVLGLAGYPFGAEAAFASQLREIHGEWLTHGKTLTGVRGYFGLVDPFNALEKQLKEEAKQAKSDENNSGIR